MKFEKIERTDKHIPLILKLDASGSPVKWLNWREAVTAHCNNKVIWSLGDPVKLSCATAGDTPKFYDLPPIIACNDPMERRDRHPSLTNRELFKRDHHMCMYCGNEYGPSKLTRDHVVPVSKGGPNTWTNTVSACRTCNHIKADRTPEQAHMPLLAVPYAPNRAEHLILQNRRIIGCQMEFLEAQVAKSSRYWKGKAAYRIN